MQYPKTLIHPNGQLAKLCRSDEYVFAKTGANVSYQDLIDFGFVELKDNRHPGKYWYPESNDTKHYYIRGCIVTNSSIRAYEYANAGNAFQTEKEAEKELEKRKAIVTIKRYISDTFGVFEPDWRNDEKGKYYIFYNYSESGLETIYGFTHIHYSPIGYFSCEEHAQEIIEKFDKELRLIWDIE